MAGEHHEDASLYDFLIDDTEMMATTPSGHLDFEDRAQQPISAPNRTSSERRLDLEGPLAPAGSAGASPRNIPAPGAPASLTATTAFGDHQQLPGASRVSVSHQQHQQHHAQFDLHGHSAPATASYFARPPLPTTSLSHVPIDWTLYGAQQHPQLPNLPISHGQFHFDVPQHSPILSHMPQQHPTDPALSYASDLVSPTNIHHASSSHYPFGVPWDDGGGHESSTPRGTTPAGAPPISNNPWVDPEDAQNDEETATAASRGKQKSRPRRSKRTARQTGESPAGPSTEPTSPSSISQNSRASITSKSGASIASTSTSSSRPSKLRSASRTSKNSHSKPNDTPEERRTRASHNLVEKQYRNRLNAQFESLLSSLPETLRAGEGDESETGPQDFGDRRVSKGEVLEMARKHIQSLERERDQLEQEKNELLGNLQRLKGSVSSEASPAGLGTPIDFNINMDDEQQHQTDEQDEK